MGINKYPDEIKQDFDIFGEQENGWEEFQKDKDYDAFLVKLKVAQNEN